MWNIKLYMFKTNPFVLRINIFSITAADKL